MHHPSLKKKKSKTTNKQKQQQKAGGGGGRGATTTTHQQSAGKFFFSYTRPESRCYSRALPSERVIIPPTPSRKRLPDSFKKRERDSLKAT